MSSGGSLYSIVTSAGVTSIVNDDEAVHALADQCGCSDVLDRHVLVAGRHRVGGSSWFTAATRAPWRAAFASVL